MPGVGATSVLVVWLGVAACASPPASSGTTSASSSSGTGGGGGTATTTSAGGAGGSGGEAACVLDGDCPGPSGFCGGQRCEQGQCVLDNQPMHTPCAEDGGQVCDGAGACVECVSDIDCASLRCEAPHCLAPSCGDQKKNGDESDVDCGGPTCPALRARPGLRERRGLRGRRL
jgi:hypothetical protein